MLTYRLCVLLEPKTFLCVLGEETLDEIFEEFRGVFCETNEPFPDQLVELLFGVSVKRRTSCVQLIKNDSVLVPVGHTIVTLLVDDFQGQVGWSSAEGLVDGV